MGSESHINNQHSFMHLGLTATSRLAIPWNYSKMQYPRLPVPQSQGLRGPEDSLLLRSQSSTGLAIVPSWASGKYLWIALFHTTL